MNDTRSNNIKLFPELLPIVWTRLPCSAPQTRANDPTLLRNIYIKTLFHYDSLNADPNPRTGYTILVSDLRTNVWYEEVDTHRLRAKQEKYAPLVDEPLPTLLRDSVAPLVDGTKSGEYSFEVWYTMEEDGMNTSPTLSLDSTSSMNSTTPTSPAPKLKLTITTKSRPVFTWTFTCVPHPHPTLLLTTHLLNPYLFINHFHSQMIQSLKKMVKEYEGVIDDFKEELRMVRSGNVDERVRKVYRVNVEQLEEETLSKCIQHLPSISECITSSSTTLHHRIGTAYQKQLQRESEQTSRKKEDVTETQSTEPTARAQMDSPTLMTTDKKEEMNMEPQRKRPRVSQKRMSAKKLFG